MIHLEIDWSSVGEMTIAEIKRTLKAKSELKKHEYEMQWRIQLNVAANQNQRKGQKFIELFAKEEEITSTKKDKEQAEKERGDLFG